MAAVVKAITQHIQNDKVQNDRYKRPKKTLTCFSVVRKFCLHCLLLLFKQIECLKLPLIQLLFEAFLNRLDLMAVQLDKRQEYSSDARKRHSILYIIRNV